MTNDEMQGVDLNEVAKLKIGFWLVGVVVALAFAGLFYFAEAPWWVIAVFLGWAVACGVYAFRWWRHFNSWRY